MGVSGLNYTTETINGEVWAIMSITGTYTDSLENAMSEYSYTDALNLKIIGIGINVTWTDFKFNYSANGTPTRIFIENISLVTTVIDDYAIYTRNTLTTMKDVTIEGYSGNLNETGGGAMRIRAADYSVDSPNSTNPTLHNISIINCCRGIRIQDSTSAYVKDCTITDVTDNAVYFAAGSYTSADGCIDCIADNCTVTNAGQCAYMNIGGSNNKFINCSMNGSRGAAVAVYNTNSYIEVDNCSFTNANTVETTTPWGGATDDFEGAACGNSVQVGDTSAHFKVQNSSFISGIDSVYYKASVTGIFETLNNTVTLANFSELIDSASYSILES